MHCVASPKLALHLHLLYVLKCADDRRFTFIASRQTVFGFVLIRNVLLEYYIPDFGTHVTTDDRGLSSLAPGGGKMGDPGNEVVDTTHYANLRVKLEE